MQAASEANPDSTVVKSVIVHAEEKPHANLAVRQIHQQSTKSMILPPYAPT